MICVFHFPAINKCTEVRASFTSLQRDTTWGRNPNTATMARTESCPTGGTITPHHCRRSLGNVSDIDISFTKPSSKRKISRRQKSRIALVRSRFPALTVGKDVGSSRARSSKRFLLHLSRRRTALVGCPAGPLCFIGCPLLSPPRPNHSS